MALVRNLNPGVPQFSKFYGCQATVLKGYSRNSRVPLHRSSKFYGCQAPMAPTLTRALSFVLIFVVYKLTTSRLDCNSCYSRVPYDDAGMVIYL